MKKNRWVIPDIHGYAKTLKTLIEKIDLSKKDELYLLGDYIDRGPASKQVIKFLMKLEEKGYNVNPIKGNHEEYLLQSVKEGKKNGDFPGMSSSFIVWLMQGGRQAMNSFNADKITDIPKKYVNWIKNLACYYEIEDAILVHAGLDFSLKNPLKDKHSMLWKRRFTVIPQKINNKKLIHGHTITKFQTILDNVNDKKSLSICLDNGLYAKNRKGYGSLVALELNSMTLIKQKNVG